MGDYISINISSQREYNTLQRLVNQRHKENKYFRPIGINIFPKYKKQLVVTIDTEWGFSSYATVSYYRIGLPSRKIYSISEAVRILKFYPIKPVKKIIL